MKTDYSPEQVLRRKLNGRRRAILLNAVAVTLWVALALWIRPPMVVEVAGEHLLTIWVLLAIPAFVSLYFLVDALRTDPTEKLVLQIMDSLSLANRAAPGALPHGGPATPSGNSSYTEGPPSVS